MMGKKTRFSITGAGVLHVRASEVLNTQNAKKQMKAAKKIQLTNVRKTSQPSKPPEEDDK